MYTQKELEERFRIMEEKLKGAKSNMNTLLAPEVCGCDAEKLTARIRYRPLDWEKNQRGEIHGGAVAAMFDTAIGMSILTFSDRQHITTTDLSVSYIRPFLGTSYLFDVELLQMGGTIARARAKALDENTGKLLASAAANFMYLSR